VFLTILTMNSKYFPTQLYLTVLCKADGQFCVKYKGKWRVYLRCMPLLKV